MQVTTIGLDLAKNVFQVHGIDEPGEVAFNRALRRAQVLAFFERFEPCLVGIEACGSLGQSAHPEDASGPNRTFMKFAANGSKEPKLSNAAICTKVREPVIG